MDFMVSFSSTRRACDLGGIGRLRTGDALDVTAMDNLSVVAEDEVRSTDLDDGSIAMSTREAEWDALRSTHFFFDIGHQNTLAFFDFPGLDLGDYAEALGGLHHLAISVEPDKWARLKDKLDELEIEYAHIHGSSVYFRGPDGERLELISDPLGEMNGSPVL